MPLDIDTEKNFDLEDLKEDIDATRKTDRWADAPADVKELFHQIEWNVIDGEHADTVGLIEPTLENGVSARTLIAGPMATGIAEVGRRFKFDEYFLPEVMMSAKSMHATNYCRESRRIGDRRGRNGTGRSTRYREKDCSNDVRSCRIYSL